jgi:ABC-type cobalamin transport system ATPase subunit
VDTRTAGWRDTGERLRALRRMAPLRGLPLRRLHALEPALALVTVDADAVVCRAGEPTSGLDPAASTDLMRLLRRLAGAGSTVVLTTHAPPDLALCDKVAFLTAEGHLAFFGTLDAARAYFRTDHLEEVYERLADEDTPREWARRFAQVAPPVAPERTPVAAPVRRPSQGALR